MNANGKAAVAILLCFTLATAGARALAQGALYYVAVSSTSYLNVREAPEADAEIITTLDRGDEIEATGATDGLWVEVQTESITITYREGSEPVYSEPLKGWVALSLLSLERPYSNQHGNIIGDGRVRLRDGPGGDFLKWVYPGEEVSVLAVVEVDAQRWYRVRHGEDRGWVLADYLKIT
jgi:uncharacterized protein YraI